MSIFEALMLIAFGSAWPFSVYKSFTSRSNSGKSFLFLIIIFLGYLSGVVHKIIYSYDYIIFLYIINALMVLADILLYFRNKKYQE